VAGEVPVIRWRGHSHEELNPEDGGEPFVGEGRHPWEDSRKKGPSSFDPIDHVTKRVSFLAGGNFLLVVVLGLAWGTGIIS